MGLIDDLYMPSRQRADDAELDAWIARNTAQAQPDLSLTMTPKGPTQETPPTGVQGMIGSNMPNVIADTLATIGKQAASGIAGQLTAEPREPGQPTIPRPSAQPYDPSKTLAAIPEAERARLLPDAIEGLFHPSLTTRALRALGVNANDPEEEILRKMQESGIPHETAAAILPYMSAVHGIGGAKTPEESAATRAKAFESPGRFNPKYQMGPEAFKDFTATINAQAKDIGRMQQQTRGKQTFGAIETAAAELIDKGRMTVEKIVEFKPGTILNAEEATAARFLRDSTVKVVERLMDAADAGDEAAKQGLEAAMMLASRVEVNVEAATGTEVARSLAARQIASRSVYSTGQQKAVARGLTPQEDSLWAEGAGDFWMRLLHKTVDPNVLMEYWKHLTTNTEKDAFLQYFENTSRTGRLVDAFLEARAAGLLSHRSFLRNIGGSGVATLWSVPEREITAIVGTIRGTAGGAYLHEGLDLLHGIWESQAEALAMAGRAMKTGESQFLPHAMQTERPMLQAISGSALGVNGPAGRAIDVLGEIIRLPFRGLVAGDDYLKFVNYSAQKYALAYRRYRTLLAEGIPMREAAREYDTLVKAPPPWLRAASEEHSLYTTFNDELINPVAKAIMAVRADEGPAGTLAKFILPFAKTPMNVQGYGAERTLGLNFLSSHFWQEIKSPEKVRGDAAWARLALGSTVLGVLALLAGEGYIHGKGPRDPKLRDQYRQHGWQPYSIELPGHKPIPFRGFDPLSQILGQAGDYAELVHQGADFPSLLQMATASVLSSLAFMEDQPMLQSLAQVVDFIRQGDARANDGLLQLIGSTMPVPGGQALSRTAIEQLDPYQRQTRGPHGGRSWLGREVDDLWEELASRTMGLTNYLYPMRDILGRPMLRQGGWWSLSPTAPSAQEPHPVFDEINRQQVTVGRLPKAMGRGKQSATVLGDEGLDQLAVELTPQEWDRWQELAGTVVIDGKTLDQSLRELIASRDYQREQDGPQGGKADLLKETFREYRLEAKEKLLEGSPRLQGLLDMKQELEEFKKLDAEEAARARPDLERRLGRPLSIGILR